MKRYVKVQSMSKIPSTGVFWVIDNKLVAFPFDTNDTFGVAKSGITYNHKKLWEHVKSKYKNKTYNYYPRGRVDFTNRGIAIIYMNPNIDDSFIPQIRQEFGIIEEPKIYYDYSDHYKCYLDDGWKADNSNIRW